MAIRTVLESLDGLDEALHPFYTETDGKFILQVEGVDEHPDVAGLSNAYRAEQEKRRKASEEAQALKAKVAELEKSAPDTAATQAKLSALQEQLDAANATNTELTGKLTGATRDRVLADALQSVGIADATFLKASQAMLSGMVKMGEDGTAFVETPMGPKLVADYVKGWAATEGKAFVTPPKGGGAQGNNGGTQKPLAEMGDAERLELARAGKLKPT